MIEDKKRLEVAVRMDSLDEGRPLRYEHSVYVYHAGGLQLAFLGYVADYKVLDVAAALTRQVTLGQR